MDGLERAWSSLTRCAGAILDAPLVLLPPVRDEGGHTRRAKGGFEPLGPRVSAWRDARELSSAEVTRSSCWPSRNFGLGIVGAPPTGCSISVKRAGRRARSFTGPGLGRQQWAAGHRSAHGTGQDLRRSPASTMVVSGQAQSRWRRALRHSGVE